MRWNTSCTLAGVVSAFDDMTQPPLPQLTHGAYAEAVSDLLQAAAQDGQDPYRVAGLALEMQELELGCAEAAARGEL